MITREHVDEVSTRLGEPEWMRNLRLEAFRAFEDLPLPSWKRVDASGSEVTYAEEWKYTSQHLADLNLSELSPRLPVQPREGSAPSHEHDQRSGHIRFDDRGISVGALPREFGEEGVIFTDMGTAVREYPDILRKFFIRGPDTKMHKFSALNRALWSAGALLYVPQGIEVEAPFQSSTLYKAGDFLATRTLIVMEPESAATIIQDSSSSSPSPQALHSETIEAHLMQGARLKYIGVQDLGGNVYEFSDSRATLGRDSGIEWCHCTFGSRLSKATIDNDLGAEGAKADSLGLFFLSRNQHLDIAANSHHTARHTTSRTLYRGVLKDSSTSVFKGKIRIVKEAPHSDADLSENILLLSDRAHSDAVPGLEIENNMVQARHGASVGQIDKERLFYLMSRGITQADAERLIVEGFFEPVVRRITREDVREAVREKVGDKVGGAS